mgnify:CR=1 FL=1
MDEDAFKAKSEVLLDGFPKAVSKMKFIFQLERGEKTNRLHYQGQVKLDTKMRLQQFKAAVAHLIPNAHLTPTSTDGSTNAEFYAMKAETKVEGPWADKDYIFPDYSDIAPPSGWQITARDLLLAPPLKRFIYWIWEDTGCTGKSDFTTWMELNHSCMGLGLSLAPDNFYAVSEFPRRCYIFDIPRTLPKRFDWAEVYMSLEKIKDRNFLSTKYKPKKVLLPVIPHVVVFSNQAPDLTTLSVDRWKIFKIINNELVQQ